MPNRCPHRTSYGSSIYRKRLNMGRYVSSAWYQSTLYFTPSIGLPYIASTNTRLHLNSTCP